MRVLAVTAVLLLVFGTVSPIRLGQGPEATEARAGETVELRCDVNYRDGEPILWYQDPTKTFVTYNREVYETLDEDRKERYSIHGSEYWHVFNLRIDNLKPIDDGFFYCGYLSGSYRVLGSARLTVIYPPAETSPVCSFSLVGQPNSTTTVVGSSVDLACMWSGGNPAPTAEWYRQEDSMTTHEEDGYVWTRRVLTPDDNGLEFTCEMDSKALDDKRRCSAMPLRIPPRATITPSTAYARVGETVEFECEGRGLPRIASYAWQAPNRLASRPERFELRDGNTIFRLLAVEAGDDGLEIRCRVRTSRGLEGTDSAVLRVVLPSTLSPTTPEATEAPSPTPKPPRERERAQVTIGLNPTSLQTTPALPTPDDGQPVATLPMTTIICVGIGAGVLLVFIIAVLVVCMKRSRKNRIERDNSIHLVNGTYETVIEGGRMVEPELSPPPGFQNCDRSRPVAAVSPLPQISNSEDRVPPVHYAKANKRRPRDSDPLYDRVPEETAVDMGIGGSTPRREPTYMNQGAVEIRQELDPRDLNVEGLTYAELELEREGRLHSKKNHTLYAKLK